MTDNCGMTKLSFEVPANLRSYSFAEAAVILQKSVRSIDRYVSDGLLERVGGPGSARISERSLEEFVAPKRGRKPKVGADDDDD